MSIDPKRIKNSRTAARAVLNIMAHYGITLTNYKPVTCAQFLLLGLDIFMADLPDQPSADTTVLDAVSRLRARPGQQKVAEMFHHSLRKADLHATGLAIDTITLADLEVLRSQSDRKAYRYTKIIGSQNFKTQLDQTLLVDLQSILGTVGVGPSGFSLMLYHLVKQDLYRHFHASYPVNLEDCPELAPYETASLYFAVKSFLLARDDVFDPDLQLLVPGVAPAVQRFLQRQGVYRVSHWFPQSAQFVAQHLMDYITALGGMSNNLAGSLLLLEPDEAFQQHRHWYHRSQVPLDGSLQTSFPPESRDPQPVRTAPD